VLDEGILYFSGKRHVDNANGELERVIYSTFILNETNHVNELFSFETPDLVIDDHGDRIFAIFNKKIMYVGNYQSETYDLLSSKLTIWSYNEPQMPMLVFEGDKFAQVESLFYIQSYSNSQFEVIWKINPIAENYEYIENEMWHDSDLREVGFAVFNDDVISGFSRLLTFAEKQELEIANLDDDMYGLWLSNNQIHVPFYYSARIKFVTQTTVINELSYPFTLFGVGIMTVILKRRWNITSSKK